MLTKFVIDTNVAINANGKTKKGEPAQGSPECQLICSKLLANCKDIHIVLDDKNLIMSEYRKNLCHNEQPLGNAFFKYLHNHQYSSDKIHTVTITPLNDNSYDFAELPENTFDKSDRKFIATAVVAQAIILYSADKEDWKKVEQSGLIGNLQIQLKDLCPNDCK